MSVVDSFHEKIVALEEKASQLEQTGNDTSKATLSRSMTTVWQRWTRLRAVAQDQEKILEDAVDEWKRLSAKVTFTTDWLKSCFVSLPGDSLEISACLKNWCFAFAYVMFL